ncbi:DNA photolyase, partial [Roseobacter sp. WL0113]|nr:DNA photolyase [Roseobacter sp. WL0113]
LAGYGGAIPGQPPPAPRLLPEETDPQPHLRTGLLLHEEDLSPGFVLDRIEVAATGLLAPVEEIGPLRPAPHVAGFRRAAQAEAATRWQARLGPTTPDLATAHQIAAWAREAGLAQIVTAYAPVGPAAAVLDQLGRLPDAPPLHRLRRSYDSAAWPHATKGFFPFRKQIPALLTRIG